MFSWDDDDDDDDDVVRIKFATILRIYFYIVLRW